MQSSGAISLPIKISLVGGGYGIAFLAGLLVAGTSAWANGGNTQASGGMAAFGDCILFFGVFGAASIIPTAAAYYFLRPIRGFWTTYGGLALLTTLSALAALVIFYLTRDNPAGFGWSTLAILRLLATPPLAILFFLGGIFSTVPVSRWMLFASWALESIVFAAFVLSFFVRF